ncbi:unnamed protein product [Boreogadus saida]
MAAVGAGQLVCEVMVARCGRWTTVPEGPLSRGRVFEKGGLGEDLGVAEVHQQQEPGLSLWTALFTP